MKRISHNKLEQGVTMWAFY